MKKHFILLTLMLVAAAAAWADGLRVMTYNVRHCAGMRFDLNLERTASVIKECGADFVALQELDSCASRSQGVYQAEELGARTLMHATYAAAIPLGSGSYGVGLLSRVCPLSVRRIAMPSRDEDRVLLVCEFEDYVVACTHLSTLEDEHNAACDTILNEAARWQKPFILMGDWNSHPDSPFFSRMKEYFAILSDTSKSTYPADHPNECIDYIAVYTGTGVQPAICKKVCVIEDMVSSDHRPIVADLKLKARNRKSH